MDPAWRPCRVLDIILCRFAPSTNVFRGFCVRLRSGRAAAIATKTADRVRDVLSQQDRHDDDGRRSQRAEHGRHLRIDEA